MEWNLRPEGRGEPHAVHGFDPGRTGEYLRLVNTHDPEDFVPIFKFHKITQGELVFRFPEAAFPEGYFELASYLGSTTLRVGQSRPFISKRS